MLGVILISVVIAAILIIAVWATYQSNGTVSTTTSWKPREIADSMISYFVPDGWHLEHRANDFLVLKRGPSAFVAFLWLVLFLPLGLLYLLTDWGRGKLTARFWVTSGKATEVELHWSGAAVRGRIARVVEGLANREAAQPASE